MRAKEETPQPPPTLALQAKKNQPIKVGFSARWWSRGDLNPRPPELRYRFYMLSHLYWVNSSPPECKGVWGSLLEFKPFGLSRVGRGPGLSCRPKPWGYRDPLGFGCAPKAADESLWCLA